MDESGKVLQAIDLIYGSILDDRDLYKALQAAAALTGASGAAYHTYDTRTGDTLRTYTVDVDPDTVTKYRAYYSSKDIRMPQALPVPVGKLFTDHGLVDDKVYKASEIYDFLLRNNITHILATWIAKGERAASTFSMQRSHKEGRFFDLSQKRFSLLIPHLVRALRIRDLLQEARQTQRAHMEIIERLPFGVVLLDEAGQVLEISEAARRLIRENEGISYKGGRIHAVHPEDNRLLQRAIGRTLTAKSQDAEPGGTVKVKRQSGKEPFNIVVIPIADPRIFSFGAPVCMLVILGAEGAAPPATRIVKEAFQLTDAEALLACTLFKGITLAEAAQQLGLSINTCKTQLKSIYAKTGWRSHVNLAKALLMNGIVQSLPMPLSLPSNAFPGYGPSAGE